MILDGSSGEGGGQILRTAVALSAITGKNIEITDIRKDRPRPGLAAQHMKAIETVASICDAVVDGCYPGSTFLDFSPGKIKEGEYKVDIGTAGSIPLLLQCLMPVAMYAPGNVKVTITGGTDITWSPSFDYLKNVTLAAVSRMGYRCDIRLIRRGYYPRGGGCVEATIYPCKLKKTCFKKIECDMVEGISHSSGLPVHVAQRQATSAMKYLEKEGYTSRISSSSGNFPSTGSGLTIWCGTSGGIALGKPGLKAEKVGTNAAKAILPELNSGAGVDIHLADQLIHYMALAGGGSFTTREITLHTRTNIWVTEQFLDVKFKIEKIKKGIFRVSV